MLFVLDFARRAGFVIDSYEDRAEGVMEKNADGRIAITRVTLRPHVVWSGDRRPPPQGARSLLHRQFGDDRRQGGAGLTHETRPPEPCRRGDAFDREQPRAVPQYVRRGTERRAVRP